MTTASNPIVRSYVHFSTNPLTPNPSFIDIGDMYQHKLTSKINMDIPSDYDWTKSSAQNYSVKYQPIDFIDYEYSKALIDYTYHGYYTKQRQQQVHNPIIEYYKSIAINNLKTPDYLQDNPWVLFTAGPMGAGKTHTLQWLHGLGVFPLEAFLKVSPDRIKKFLPEYGSYLKNDEKNVGRLLRTEVGFLCEIIIWEILYSTNICVWMDTSLRHSEFFETMLNNITLRFPKYKIGLLNVQCDAQIVFKRAKKRANITGRHVPESDIQQSIDQVPKSIDTLKDLADVVVHIDNSFDSTFQKTPKLLQIQWNDRNKNKTKSVVDNPSWNLFYDIWTGKFSQTSKL